jgi:predicted alpha/beta-hydrolase family hydrolase
LADRLLLMSYPLHPPGKPQQLRTAHFPMLHTPALFVHGSRDPFASTEELNSAIALIPVPAHLLEIEGAGHDLGRNHAAVAARIASSFLDLHL